LWPPGNQADFFVEVERPAEQAAPEELCKQKSVE
jgi:hypothetical protein